MSSRTAFIRSALLIVTLVACNDPETPPIGPPLGKVVVLNGQGETGVSVLPDAAGTPVHLTFSDFDGASFSLRNDTVISAASKSKGDLLYIGDLKTRSVRKVQLPPGSNPAGAAFAVGPVFGLPAGPGTRLFVALRDSTRAVSVFLPADSGEPVIYRHPNAGVCPVDVVVTSTKVWYLDSNQRCRSDYATLGPSRLVPVFNLGASDTINLGAGVIGAQRAFVAGNKAIIMSSGDYFSIPGAVTVVDLTTRASTTRALPADAYAVSLRIGANGIAYVTAAAPYPADFLPRVYAIDPATVDFTGTRVASASHLRLVKNGGGEADCYAATADADGNVYCLDNGDVLAQLLVFNAAGDQIRSTPAGSRAYDITLR